MPNPDLIPEPFAQSGDKNPIPLERAIADPIYRASWKAGFPPDTRLPKDVGGEAPDGLDFNGVLNIISQAVVFLQKGNAYQFDASLAPYPIGALVRSNDNLTTYQSTVVSNSNNPNSNMTGWRIYNGFGFIVDNLTTNDSAKALSAAQGKVLQDNKLEENKVGAANGVASLGANTKVPVAQLPAATISDAGVLRFATATEVANKSNVNAAVTPKNVADMFSSNIVVESGIISDGETIPLPKGFTEAQCKWMVSPSDTTLCSLGANNQGVDSFHLKCFTTGRVVTAQISFYNTATGFSNTYNKSYSANYIIIGVK